ncbi:MAG: hypothetical protein AB8B79_01400 [Granulosicoccus sp.]
MRPIFSKTAVAVLVCAPLSWQISHANEWSGSYSAQGQCFCVGELPASLNGRIVPTPIGGQTVSQICKRVGAGPELLKDDGLFNFPVYKDPQCGHGPFADKQVASDPACAGSLDGNNNGCQKPGPKWNLKRAFGMVAATASAKSATTAKPVSDTETSSQVSIASPVVSSANVLSEVEKADKGTEKKLLKATIIKSPSTAGNAFDPSKLGSEPVEPEKPAKPKAFAGKSITIDGQRYLQAHSKIPANGGEPGSKIILDGLVYLRDDDALDPQDLFKVKQNNGSSPKKKTATPKVSTATRPDAVADKVKEQATAKQLDQERKQRLAYQANQIQQNAKVPTPLPKQAEEPETLTKQAELSDAELLPKADAEQADAEQAEEDKQAQLQAQAEAARQAVEEKRLATEKKRLQSVQESAAQVVPADSKKSEAQAEKSTSETASTLLTALRLPPDTRQSSRDFAYLEAMPVSYDVGGNGVWLEGSASSHTRFQYVGRMGLATEYQELMIGGGYYLTPADADRLTVVVVAGLEYGSFELSDDQLALDFDDSGIYLSASSRLVINDHFELQGGVGYSTFFEGDAMIFGGGYYHVNRRLDIVSRFELGDNDLLGIGVRFYY